MNMKKYLNKKILGLINNIEEYQKIYNDVLKKYKSRI